jgi:hypothetical protein
MLQQVPGNDLDELNEYNKLFSKEEQATNWCQFKGFSEELKAPDTGYFKDCFNTDLNPNLTCRKNMP